MLIVQKGTGLGQHAYYIITFLIRWVLSHKLSLISEVTVHYIRHI